MADKCKHDPEGELYDYVEKVQREIKYDTYSGCFNCGMWQGICDRWERNEKNGRWKKRMGGRCQYQGVLVRAVGAIWGCHGVEFI